MTLKDSIYSFRHKLGLVFDDDLGTRQWYNIVDWIIVFMILLSSLEIFLATLPIGLRIQHILDFINEFTLWFFIVEVSLRIWAAPEQDSKYKGIMGRLRYCFTFYGFIDVISTYPFLVQYFIPLPLNALKVLRTARIIRVFRITRYARSFNLLSDAIKEKKNELIVSMQFLVIVTFILSIILYVFEHDAQPEVYDNGFYSVIWAFAQYIGDPGQFADTPPVTLAGKIIACIVGIMGIAIVAVPAGILSAGFTEAIESRNKNEEVVRNAEKLLSTFQRKLDRPTGYQVVLPFQTVTALQAKLCMTMDSIVEAVNSESAPHFRLVNTASSVPVARHQADEIAVEHFIVNRPYGCLIDRKSNITIISPSSCIDMGVGNWAFYLAAIGGFNFISREVGDKACYRSYLSEECANALPGLAEFIADLKELLSRKDAWSFTILVASGALEPEYPTQIHFDIGGKKGDMVMGGDDLLVHDSARYTKLYQAISGMAEEKLGYTSDHQKYNVVANPRKFFNRHQFKSNNVVLRIEWNRILWDPNRIVLADVIAQGIWNAILNAPMPSPDSILKIKGIGFADYLKS
jgi:voltage-gated potassium channel